MKLTITRKDLLMAFDAKTLHSSAMADPEPSCPKVETSSVFEESLEFDLIDQFNSLLVKKGSLWKIKFCKPRKLMFQHFPAEEIVIDSKGKATLRI